jgi:hypothetical protein
MMLERWLREVGSFIGQRLHGLLMFLILGFILFLILACGLESVLTLNPPEYVETSLSNDYFKVRITEDNSEPEFRGVEFYYKLYYPAGTGSIPDSAINIRNFDDLLLNGFKRLSSEDDEEGDVGKPLLRIPIDERGKRSLITIDFWDIDDVEAFAVDEEPGGGGFDLADFNLRRGVVDSQTKMYKAFNDFELTDADVPAGVSSFPADVNLLLYALSFGKEDLSTDAYSKSVYLLRIEIVIDTQ